ncbi:Fatty-acid amide hydrolase 2 [Nymphon striatum]|nr:Fatty-acid amide hydrolase 2 [Nymphon striatum]
MRLYCNTMKSVSCSMTLVISAVGCLWTAGLVSRRGKVAEKDCDAVAMMRKSGAIPIAITNVSELCLWMESSNNLYGRTNNPYNTTRMVGGSSGGEACLISAVGSPFGIGSDIGGSIRMPAFFNGIFGHKPSKGDKISNFYFSLEILMKYS